MRAIIFCVFISIISINSYPQVSEIKVQPQEIKVIARNDTIMKYYGWSMCLLHGTDTIIVLTTKNKEIPVKADSSLTLEYLDSVQDDYSYRLYSNNLYFDGILVFPIKTKVYLLKSD